MKAIVLCAGFGTRLLPLTRDRAKPLLPVAGVPIVEHLLRAFDKGRVVDEVALVSNHAFAEDFRDWRDHARFDRLRVKVLDNGVKTLDERKGAVGDLVWARRELSLEGPAVVAAGDNLFRIEFGAFFADVARRDGSVVATYEEPDIERLRRTGVATLADDGRIVALVEKPAQPPSTIACPALYALTREALAALDEFCAASSEIDQLGSFLSWLVERQPVYAHVMQGERWDVGDRASYELADAWWSDTARS